MAIRIHEREAMKTITIRELRSRSAQVWEDLAREREIVVTSNGRPIGILSSASPATLERTLAAIRRARASLAVLEEQTRSAREGRDRIRPEEIEAEVNAVRHKRPR